MASPKDESRDMLEQRVVPHLFGLLGIGLVVWISIRVILAARWNTTTALEIVRSAGVAEIALGVVTAGISSLLVALSMVAWTRWRYLRILGREGVAALVVALIGSYVAFFTVFWGEWVLGLVLLSPIFLIRLLPKRLRPEGATKRGLAMTVAWYGGFVTVMLLTSVLVIGYNLWIPAEVIETEDRGVFIGYVLNDEGDWASILLNEDRLVEIVPIRTIEHRQVCNLGGMRNTSLPALIASDLQEHPECKSIVSELEQD